MSRKDTIIIAVLINAALLALLFVLALNTDDDVTEQPDLTKSIVERARAEQKATPIQLTMNTPDETDSFMLNLSTEEDMGQPIVLDEDGFIELDKSPSIIVKPVAQVERLGDDQIPYVEVTVKRGDALEKIARSNGTTVDAIKKANNLSSTKLSIGQVLKVPTSKKDEVVPQTSVVSKPKPIETKLVAATESSTQSEQQFYTIKSGDNPWKIARQYNVRFEDLLKMNALDEEKARNLKIGDKIRVR